MKQKNEMKRERIGMLAFVMLIFISGIGSAQTSGKPKLDYVVANLRGNVKELIETNVSGGKTARHVYRINEKKQITYLELNSHDGSKTAKVEFEYNPAGKVIRESCSLSGKKTDNAASETVEASINELPYRMENFPSAWENSEKIYEYWENGNLKHSVYTKKDGSNPEKTEVYCNSQGKATQVIRQADGRTQTDEYTYDAKGNRKEHKVDGQTMSDEDEGEDMGPWYDYDAKKRIISYSDYGGSETRYTYNENDYLTQEKEAGNWASYTKSYTGYQYDAQKNWIKRTVKTVGTDQNEKPLNRTVTVTRTITYY
jgi:YD repeat-containing protein